MKQELLFEVKSSVHTHSVFQVIAKDIKLALTKAENIVRGIEPGARVISIAQLNAKLLEE